VLRVRTGLGLVVEFVSSVEYISTAGEMFTMTNVSLTDDS